MNSNDASKLQTQVGEPSKSEAAARDAGLTLLDEFPTPVWRSGLDAKCDYFNRTWLEFTGRTMEQELGDGWVEGIHPDDVARCVQTYLIAFHARQPFELEYRLRRHDGEYRWMVDYGRPFNDPHGQFAGYIGSCYDVTERKQAEAALRESEARFQAFMDHTPAMVIIKDAAGRYVYLNTTTERLVHATLDEMRGKTNFSRLPYETARQLRDNDLEVLATGQAQEFIETVPMPDGQAHYWLTSKFPIQNAGEAPLLGVIAFDITERKQLEQRLTYQAHLLDNIHDAVIATDEQFAVTAWNRAAEAMYGWQAAEALGRNVQEVLRSEMTPDQRTQAVRTVSETGRYRLEVMHHSRNGDPIFIEGTTIALHDETGRITGYASVNRDITERKRMEEELRNSEARLRQVLGALPAAAYTCDANGLITYFNERALDLWGRAPKLNDPEDRFCGSFKLFHPDGTPIPHDQCWMAVAIKEQKAVHGAEIIIERTDGSRRFGLAHANPLWNASGQLVGAVNVLIDITARKAMEDELRKREAQLAAAQRVAHLGSWEWDLATNVVTWSGELHRIMGLQTHEFGSTYEAFLERVHPDDRALVRSITQRAYQGRQTFAYPCRMLRADGAERTLFKRGVVVVDETGKPIQMYGTAQDITESQIVEEALQKERDFIATVIDTVGTVVVVLDCRGHIVRFNRTFEQLTGYAFEEVKGRDYMDLLLIPEEAEAAKAVFADLCAGHFPNTYENYVVARDGSRCMIAWSNTAILNAEGAVEYVIGTGTDITERRQAELERERLFAQVQAGREQLQALSRRLVEVQETERRFLARELHDEIGQSLTGLKLMLETNGRLPAGLPSEVVPARLADALAIVNELMARVRELSLDLRPAMLDDLGLLPALLWHFERYTAQSRVRVQFKHSGLEHRLPPQVETAAYRIVQEALTNVARHASVDVVTVRLWVDAATLNLHIEDWGIGFVPDAALEAAATSGLAGMRERALLLQGRLKVESAPGAGTRVTAELPLNTSLERREQKR